MAPSTRTSSPTPSQLGSSFLSFNKNPPRIVVTDSKPHPPERLLLGWREEGFDARYLPFDRTNPTEFVRSLRNLHDAFEFNETYAIVCYGEAASVVLNTALKPLAKCCAIIAFYPPILPSPKKRFPSLLHLQVHVAVRSLVTPLSDECEWKVYRYEDCAEGFADASEETYEPVEADLAWSRALACVRRAFKKEVDLEPLADAAWNAKYKEMDAERGAERINNMMTHNKPHVTIMPTVEGGLGRRAIYEFYSEYFIPSMVDDFDIRLISRTIGVDRVVDEMVVSFTHSDEVDWILPGVPPTGKYVEIAVVSILAIRGGKLVSEHMYWDQASVLVQVGLLDPDKVPKNLKNKGLKTLPVTRGQDVVEKLVEPKQDDYNRLLEENGL